MSVRARRKKKADESLEDYVNAMLEERKGINNIYMQVVCSNSVIREWMEGFRTSTMQEL